MPHPHASPDPSMWEEIAWLKLSTTWRGGRKTQPSQLFAARQRRCTSHLVAQRSSKPRDLCYRMCTSFLPPKTIKVRGTKHQCKPPSFLTGELSSTAKSSLPEGLCGWRLLENLTHWEVGHVQKNIVSALVALESNQKVALLATRANQRQNQVKNQLVWTQSWS